MLGVTTPSDVATEKKKPDLKIRKSHKNPFTIKLK